MRSHDHAYIPERQTQFQTSTLLKIRPPTWYQCVVTKEKESIKSVGIRTNNDKSRIGTSTITPMIGWA